MLAFIAGVVVDIGFVVVVAVVVVVVDVVAAAVAGMPRKLRIAGITISGLLCNCSEEAMNTFDG